MQHLLRVRLGKKECLTILVIAIQCALLFPSSVAIALKGLLAIGIIIFCVCKRGKIINAKIVMILMIILMLALLSFVFTKPSINAASYRNKALLSYICVIAASQCIENKEDIEYAFRVLLYGGLAYMLAIVILQGPMSLIANGVNRTYTGGVIMNYTYVSIPTSILAGWVVLSDDIKKSKSIPVWIFVYLMNLLSERRKASLIPLLALVIIYGLKNYKKWKVQSVAKLIVLLIIGSVFLIYSTQNQFLYEHFGYRVLDLWNSIIASDDVILNASTKSLTSRRLSGSIGFGYFLNNPFRILGMGNYSKIVSGKASMPHAHNNYIEMLTTVGFWTFLIYYSVYVYVIVKGRKFLQNSYTVLSVSIILVFLVLDFATTTYWETTTVLYLMLCYLYIFYQRKEEKYSYV